MFLLIPGNNSINSYLLTR